MLNRFFIVFSMIRQAKMAHLIFVVIGLCPLFSIGHLMGQVPLEGKVMQYKGRSTIHINDQPKVPMLYALSDVPGGRYAWEELPQHNIWQFCEAGIELFQLDLSFQQMWLADHSLAIQIAQKQIQGVLEVCPNAAIFFRLHLNPPDWWLDEHPLESVAYDSVPAVKDVRLGLNRALEPDARHPFRASMASEVWKTAIEDKLARFCKALAASPEGKAVAGIQVAYGIYGEWHQWGLHQYEADFSKPMRLGFQAWLKAKYATKEQFQKAWKDSKLTFDEVEIPGTSLRSKVQAGIFRDPVLDTKVVDYYTYQHELVANTIISFCQTIKSNWPRPIITGTFYGYFFSVFNRQAAGGHLALKLLMESSDVDYLSGPQVYYPEEGFKAGEPYRSRSLIHSMQLNGKLWLDEYDQQPRRTWPYLSLFDNTKAYQMIMQENKSMLQRSLVFSLLKGQGLWFYDFGPAGMHLNRRNQYNSQLGTSGYWDDPEYLQIIRQVKTWAETLMHEAFESMADVLVVYDTESILYMPSTKENACPITEHLINWSTLALYYSGCLFDPIHLDDLNKVNLDQYRVVVFMNTFFLDAKEREQILNRVVKDNRHLIWTYAPGYLSPSGVNMDQIEEMVGFTLDTFELDTAPAIHVITNAGDSIRLTAKGRYSPVFSIKDPTVQSVGFYTENGKPGLGFKRFETFSSWFSGVPITDYRVFQSIFEQADVQLFSKDKDIVYGGTNWLLYHSIHKGGKSFSWKGRSYQLEFDTAPASKLVHLKTNEILFENQ